MNHDQFTRKLAAEMQHQYKGTLDIFRKTVRKNNGICRSALEIHQGKTSFYPTIYTDQYYLAWKKGVPIRHLADLALEQCAVYGAGKVVPADFFSSYEGTAERIYCKLVSKSKNEELLRETPHRLWNDLAIVPYYLVDSAVVPDASILIRHEHIALWQVDAETLLSEAWERTVRYLGAEFRKLKTVLEELSGISHSNEDISDDEPLYILSNRSRCFGAVCVAYPDMAAMIAEKVGNDYYVLPSSVHECLILEAEESYEREVLDRMVREINRTQLAAEEVLADHVYYYSRKEARFLYQAE